MGKLKYDLTGQKFGRVLVLKRAENKNRRVAYFCKCDCGKEFVVLGQNLANGTTKSCGCLKLELVTKRAKIYIGVTEKVKQDYTEYGVL